jgi:glycosyltransferase involved in cell wall biosynthesis
MNPPLISIVIPTRQRRATVLGTVRTALNQREPNIEILVSDNASTDGTEEAVRSLRDDRLRYVRTSQRLCMSDSWEFAVEHSRGDHVMLIGDDDGVVAGGCTRLLKLIDDTGSSLFFWRPHEYRWPSSESAAWLLLRFGTGKPKAVNIRERAKRSIVEGGWGAWWLPKLYHGLVSREILKRIQAHTGRVFHSKIPDTFLTFALPAFAETAVFLSNPVTVNGLSPASQTLAFNKVISGGEREPILHEFGEENGEYVQSSSLPPMLPDEFNLTTDAILSAMRLFPEIYHDIDFNYSAYHALNAVEAKLLNVQKMLDTLNLRSELRKYHHFNTLVFLEFWLRFKLARVLQRIGRVRPGQRLKTPQAPNDILECSKMVTNQERLCGISGF